MLGIEKGSEMITSIRRLLTALDSALNRTSDKLVARATNSVTKERGTQTIHTGIDKCGYDYVQALSPSLTTVPSQKGKLNNTNKI